MALSLRALLSHINTVHSSSPDFHVICGIDGCVQEYRVYNSFYYHVKRRHYSHFISHKSRSSGSQNADNVKAKGNNSRACASADAGIQVEERLFENFGIPLQPEFLPNEHDVSGDANYEEDFNSSGGQEPDIADSSSSADGAAFTPLTETEQEAMHVS